MYIDIIYTRRSRLLTKCGKTTTIRIECARRRFGAAPVFSTFSPMKREVEIRGKGFPRGFGADFIRRFIGESYRAAAELRPPRGQGSVPRQKTVWEESGMAKKMYDVVKMEYDDILVMDTVADIQEADQLVDKYNAALTGREKRTVSYYIRPYCEEDEK